MISSYTGKINMEPENGPLEDYLISSTSRWFSGSMLIFQGVIEKHYPTRRMVG